MLWPCLSVSVHSCLSQKRRHGGGGSHPVHRQNSPEPAVTLATKRVEGWQRVCSGAREKGTAPRPPTPAWQAPGSSTGPRRPNPNWFSQKGPWRSLGVSWGAPAEATWRHLDPAQFRRADPPQLRAVFAGGASMPPRDPQCTLCQREPQRGPGPGEQVGAGAPLRWTGGHGPPVVMVATPAITWGWVTVLGPQ